MFKSVFMKYLLAFTMIVLLSFTVIIVIISMILGEYAKSERTDIMKNAAVSSASYLANELSEHSSEDWEQLSDDSRREISSMLSIVCAQAEDITILLTDESGRIQWAEGKERDRITTGATLPSALGKEAVGNGGGIITQDTEPYGLFDSPHSIYAQPIVTSDSAVRGAVLVCAAPELMTDLSDAIVGTVTHSILWILLAVLIAVYLVTERIVSPLRAIRQAAKSFADGNFDVRVPVRGKDEIAELAVAFNHMAESMRNYDAMRNNFMSNVSHDLRTPMTSITGFIDGILDGVIPPQKHEYYLRLVSDEVKRLSRLVASLLDLSRIQAGERKFTMAPFDICEMGRQILISFEQKITEKNLTVEFQCDSDNMNVVADRDAIHQILYNLCDNAVKFSREGGCLRLTLRKLKNRKLLISVYNEGDGIAQSELPHVFDRFYKSDKSRGLNKSGVGLGLFIAKTIVHAHHERIWVESETGKSCCFNFTLPGE